MLKYHSVYKIDLNVLGIFQNMTVSKMSNNLSRANSSDHIYNCKFGDEKELKKEIWTFDFM